MRHGVHKIKFNEGVDANKMLMRKLAYNFFTYGQMVTTNAKAKALRPLIERIVHKTKDKTQANKNYLLKIFNSSKLVDGLFTDVGAALKDKVGGHVRIIKLLQRENDGSQMSRIEWVYPVVMSGKKTVRKLEKVAEKTTKV